VALPRNAVPELLEKLRKEFPSARSDTQDGLRLDWPDKWLLVRPSNTEPIVRAIAEAKSMSDAEQLCRRTAELAESCSPG
jgi:phosphomannomutase